MHRSTTTSPVPSRVAMALLAILFALLAVRAVQRPANDLAVFHAAGARFAAGAPLYDVAQDAPYRYAPGIAALFAPLAALPFERAKVLWIALTAALALLVALAGARQHGREAPLAVPLAWACLVQPLAQELAHGQVDVLVLALAVASFAIDDAGRPLAAGALLSVAIALKVAPVVLVADWALRRRWRALAGVAAGGLLVAALLIPRYGIGGAWAEHLAWFRTQSADAAVMVDTAANQSLWAWSRSVGLGTAGGLVAVVALLTLVVTRSAAERRRELLLAIVPLVSAYGWPQLFVLAVPMVGAVLTTRGPAAWVAGISAASVTLLSYDVAGPRVEAWAQAHRVLGLALLVAIVAARTAPARRARARA